MSLQALWRWLYSSLPDGSTVSTNKLPTNGCSSKERGWSTVRFLKVINRLKRLLPILVLPTNRTLTAFVKLITKRLPEKFARKNCRFKKSAYLCAPNAELFYFAEIAQLVEHNLAKVRVASSSLVFRSMSQDITSSFMLHAFLSSPDKRAFFYINKSHKIRFRIVIVLAVLWILDW